MVDTLHAKGFKLKGIRNGIRAKLENGLDIDVYTLKIEPSQVRARLKLEDENEDTRKAALSETRSILARGLDGFAEPGEFRFSREGNGIYHYYAQILMNEDWDVVQTKKPKDTETPPQNPIERAIAIIEPVDAKTFREGLDDLGLPRSSILRVALMHLYRAAIDEDELRMILTEESEKITAPRDLALLERIKKKNKIDFLAPLLQALWDASNQELTIVLD